MTPAGRGPCLLSERAEDGQSVDQVAEQVGPLNELEDALVQHVAEHLLHHLRAQDGIDEGGLLVHLLEGVEQPRARRIAEHGGERPRLLLEPVDQRGPHARKLLPLLSPKAAVAPELLQQAGRLAPREDAGDGLPA